MPDESVQCCVTSPPYWGLRDYGVDGQLGLESSPEEFVAGMVEVFAEVRRVLRGDGTLWLNIGDSYARGGHGKDAPGGKQATNAGALLTARTGVVHGLKQKDLVGIPWMVAFALRADGWYLRRDIIWAKPNPMPESITDRPTSAHEYLFLLSKSPRYFYDAEAVREPATYAAPNGAQQSPYAQGLGRRSPEQEKARQDKQRGHSRRHDGFSDRWDAMSKDEQQALGRNKRSVWTIATRPYPDAHFATFPPALVEPCILAGSPPKSCGECGAPWRRLTEREDQGFNGSRYGERAVKATGGAGSGGTAKSTLGSSNGKLVGKQRTVGWTPTCEHDDDSGTPIVLDPFAGAATTGLLAAQHGRDFVGIELNQEYVELGEDRIRRWEANPNGDLTGDPDPLEGQLSIEAVQV